MSVPGARITGLLGINKSTALLLAAIVLIGAGEETWMRFVPKYLEALGASAFLIGLFDAVKTLLGSVYAYPGGVLADRWGHRRALLAFTAASIAGYAVFLFLPSWHGVIGGAFLFLAWSNLSLPATFSLVGASLPAQKHTMGIGMQSLIRRVPVILGPIAGGILLDSLGVARGVRAGVLISLAFAAVALLVQKRLPGEASPSTARLRLAATVRGFSPELRRLLLSDILVRFCERIPYAWVVIYAMDSVGVSASRFGLLVAVEMAAAIACYIPASALADRHGKQPFVLATFVFFTLFPLALLAAHTFPALVVAFLIRGLKEFGEPARKALILGCAAHAGRGQTIGAYYLIRDVTVTAGSFLGAALWQLSPAVNLWTAFAAGAAGALFYLATLPALPSSRYNPRYVLLRGPSRPAGPGAP